jgi:hypothetical protein
MPCASKTETKRDKKGQKGTKRDKKGQKGTNRDKQRQTETNRDKQRQTETNRDRDKREKRRRQISVVGNSHASKNANKAQSTCAYYIRVTAPIS